MSDMKIKEINFEYLTPDEFKIN